MNRIEAVQRTARSIQHDADPKLDPHKLGHLMSDSLVSPDYREALGASFRSLTVKALLLGIELTQTGDEGERARIVEQIGDVMHEIVLENLDTTLGYLPRAH